MSDQSSSSLFMPYSASLPKRPGRRIDQDLQIIRHRPRVQEGATLFLENRDGKLCADGWPAKLFQHERQFPLPGKNIITGAEIESQSVLKRIAGAELLDELLADSTLYPDAWKQSSKIGEVKFVFALGTIYGAESRCRHREGTIVEYARGVYWWKGKLCELTYLIGSPWYGDIGILTIGDDIK